MAGLTEARLPTLVIETATAACSVALLDGAEVLAASHDVVGRGHAEYLLPMIAALPGGGRADHILVDCGPGSFTGVRVGIAAARALALGWGATLAGFSSLSLLAAAAFAREPQRTSLSVLMEGGHGELFVQSFDAPLIAMSALASLRPAAALDALGGRYPVGSGVRWLEAEAYASRIDEPLPNAADVRLLPAAFAALPPRPIYGRAPDAKPARS